MFNKNHIKFQSLKSTNEFALSLKGMPVFSEGLLVTTDHQSKGKGQLGSTWDSASGLNILLSVVIEPKILLNRQFDINKIVTLAIYDFLTSFSSNISVKWPNDILLDKKKIAGVLIENIVANNIISYSVIGIGLNVNQLHFQSFSIPATSLSLHLGGQQDLLSLREVLLDKLTQRIISYRKGKDLDLEYNNALFLRDEKAGFVFKDKEFNGVIRGVSKKGLLQVEVMRELREFNMKEIQFIF